MISLRAAFRTAPMAPAEWVLRRVGRLLPQGLYARSLIIIIASVVLL